MTARGSSRLLGARVICPSALAVGAHTVMRVWENEPCFAHATFARAREDGDLPGKWMPRANLFVARGLRVRLAFEGDEAQGEPVRDGKRAPFEGFDV